MFGVYYMEMVRRISRTFYSNSRIFFLMIFLVRTFFVAPICNNYYNGSNGSIYRCRKSCTVSVLVQPLKVMDLFVEGTINIFRSQLIALLLEPSLFDNVHLLVQKLLDLQEKFNEFASFVEFSDYEQN